MTYQINHLIPDNYAGKPINLSSSVILPSREEAIVCFTLAAKRLLNPQVWHEISGWGRAYFELAGADREEKERLAEEGDYFSIGVPESGPAAGDVFDSVVVEKIHQHKNPDGTSEWAFLRIRLCSNPRKPNGETALFFKSLASSSCIIERNGNIVTARYHGRNEASNEPGVSLSGNVPNSTDAAAAAIGLSGAQWTALLQGLLAAETTG